MIDDWRISEAFEFKKTPTLQIKRKSHVLQLKQCRKAKLNNNKNRHHATAPPRIQLPGYISYTVSDATLQIESWQIQYTFCYYVCDKEVAEVRFRSSFHKSDNLVYVLNHSLDGPFTQWARPTHSTNHRANGPRPK